MLEATVRERRLRWFGHVQCMEDTRRANQALHWNPDENKKPGQPRFTWRATLWINIECMETFISRQHTEKSGRNGLSGVPVIGRTKGLIVAVERRDTNGNF